MTEWDACDEHERAHLVGEECIECVTEERDE